jgi:hypothetical protein
MQRKQIADRILTRLQDRETLAKHADSIGTVLRRAREVSYSAKGRFILDTTKVSPKTLCSIYRMVCADDFLDDGDGDDGPADKSFREIYREFLMHNDPVGKAIEDATEEYRVFSRKWGDVLPNCDDVFVLHFISERAVSLQSVRADYLSMRYVAESLMMHSCGKSPPTPPGGMFENTVSASFEAYKIHVHQAETTADRSVETFIAEHITAHHRLVTELKRKYKAMQSECLHMLSQQNAPPRFGITDEQRARIIEEIVSGI